MQGSMKGTLAPLRLISPPLIIIIIITSSAAAATARRMAEERAPEEQEEMRGAESGECETRLCTAASKQASKQPTNQPTRSRGYGLLTRLRNKGQTAHRNSCQRKNGPSARRHPD